MMTILPANVLLIVLHARMVRHARRHEHARPLLVMPTIRCMSCHQPIRPSAPRVRTALPLRAPAIVCGECVDYWHALVNGGIW